MRDLSPVCAARSRSADDTANTFALTPARASWAWLASSTRRHCGQMSVLVSTTVTFGQDVMTCLSSSSSVEVSSLVASDTSSTASAWSRAVNVLVVWAERRSPTPGVSISTRPEVSSARGMPTSARTTSPECPALTSFATWSMATGTRSVGVSVIARLAAELRTSAADGVSACCTKVGTVVVMSSPTAQTGALTRAFTSWLLPCFASPITSTLSLGSSCRARFSRNRSARSGRLSVVQAPIVSSSTSSQGTAITRVSVPCSPSWVKVERAGPVVRQDPPSVERRDRKEIRTAGR